MERVIARGRADLERSTPGWSDVDMRCFPLFALFDGRSRASLKKPREPCFMGRSGKPIGCSTASPINV